MESVKSNFRDNNRLHYVQIKLTEELTRCHQDVLSVVRQFPLLEANHSHFPEEVSDSIVDYVNSFNKYSGKYYSPHVTLGYGDKPPCIETNSSRLPLCVHMSILFFFRLFQMVSYLLFQMCKESFYRMSSLNPLGKMELLYAQARGHALQSN
jgi:hypothetical protein